MREAAGQGSWPARQLCAKSLEWAIAQRILPSYEPTGKYRPPADPPHRLNFGKETWLVAHYADQRGELYANLDAWRRAFRFVRSFTQSGLSQAASQELLLRKVFGSFGDLEPPAIFAAVKTALLQQGFELANLDEAAASAVFRLRDSCDVASLPEPYGKWLQSQKGKVPWKDKVELLVELRFQAHAEPRLMKPFGSRNYLDVILSAPALVTVPRLARSLAATLRTPALLDAGAGAMLENSLRQTLVPIMQRW